MWNGPIEVIIEDLFIILGPNMSVISHNESFMEENDATLEESYDENNMYNIFEH
jgi:hypothetical protein